MSAPILKNRNPIISQTVKVESRKKKEPYQKLVIKQLEPGLSIKTRQLQYKMMWPELKSIQYKADNENNKKNQKTYIINQQNALILE